MDLRSFDADMIEHFTLAIQALPKYNTKDFTKRETLSLLERREWMMFEVFATFAGRIADAVREESSATLGHCAVAPRVLDFFRQEVIDECVAAIEAEEKNALDPYLQAAE